MNKKTILAITLLGIFCTFKPTLSQTKKYKKPTIHPRRAEILNTHNAMVKAAGAGKLAELKAAYGEFKALRDEIGEPEVYEIIKYEVKPIHAAAKRNRIKVLDYILNEVGENLSASKDQMLVESPLEARDREDKRPLHYAAREGALDAVKRMVKFAGKGEEEPEDEETLEDVSEIVNLPDKYGFTALMWSAAKPGGKSSFAVNKYLADHGASLSLKTKSALKKKGNQDALDLARKSGNLRTYYYLKKKKVKWIQKLEQAGKKGLKKAWKKGKEKLKETGKEAWTKTKETGKEAGGIFKEGLKKKPKEKKEEAEEPEEIELEEVKKEEKMEEITEI